MSSRRTPTNQEFLMSDLRRDPLTGEWAIIAERRGDRPIEYQQNFIRNGQPTCPFCGGNENLTPPTIQEYFVDPEANTSDSDRQPQWIVRVVPNKYPALERDDSNRTQESNGFLSDSIARQLYECVPAVGSNEIIIESARHVVSFSELNDNELKFTMRAFRDAIERCEKRPEAKAISLFKNCRFPAGASIEHTHSQAISLPVIPVSLERQLENCSRFFDQHGKQLLESVIDQELEMDERVVAEENGLIAFCPYASRTPYQVCITSRQNHSAFADMPDEEMMLVAKLTRKSIRALEKALPNPAYNLLFHVEPIDVPGVREVFRWYVEIFPRLTRAAGLELGTGCWINPVSPEFATKQLREQIGCSKPGKN